MKTKTRKRPPVKPKKKTTRVTVDFPISQHRKLKARAALEGVTLQEYIRSRVIEEEMSDSELKPIVHKIIEENREILQRLAKK